MGGITGGRHQRFGGLRQNRLSGEECRADGGPTDKGFQKVALGRFHGLSPSKGEKSGLVDVFLVLQLRLRQLSFEAFVFSAQFGDFILDGCQDWLQFLQRQALGNMLRAVPVQGFDGYDNGPFRPGVVAFNVKLFDQRRIIFDVDQLGAAPDFQAAAVRVIHQDQRDPVIAGQIAGAHVLPVTLEIGVSDCVLVDDRQEPARPATELRIRPAGFRYRRLINPSR